MTRDIRKKIGEAIDYYQKTQSSGLKEVEKQLTLFSDNCVFIVFANVGVMGTSGIIVLKNKTEIREAFQQYNNHIGDPKNIHIDYYDRVIDVETKRCNFNMHIQVNADSQPRIFFNILQFHFDDHFEIFKAYNWQGDTEQVTVEDILLKNYKNTH